VPGWADATKGGATPVNGDAGVTTVRGSLPRYPTRYNTMKTVSLRIALVQRAAPAGLNLDYHLLRRVAEHHAFVRAVLV